MEVSGQLYAPTDLPPGKEPLLDRRLGGLQSRSERDGEEENSQPLSGLEPSIIQPVAQALSYPLHSSELSFSLIFATTLHLCSSMRNKNSFF
jgi:hypothetical protein